MARETDSKTARQFDKRTVERSIKKGLISRKDYEKYLASLNDVADKATYGVGAEVEAPAAPIEPAASADGVPEAPAAPSSDPES